MKLTLLMFISSLNAQLPAITELDQLNGFNGFKVESSLNDYFGSSIAHVGDINGDGISDIAVGDTTADNNSTDTGSVYVIFGKDNLLQSEFNVNSLNGINGVEFIGEQALGQAGWSVNSAGDVNNDGIDDMMIGALTVDNGESPNTGAVYIVYGNSNGFSNPLMLSTLDGKNGFKIYGSDQDDFLGRSVNTIGDFNNDSMDDIIFCTADKSVDTLFQAGVCYVLFGHAAINHPFDLSSLDGSNGFVIQSSISSEGLGYVSGPVGDFNADGVVDLYIGTGNSDKAYIIYGQTSPIQSPLNLADLNGDNGFTITDISASLSTKISFAGDINQDDINDLIIGSPNINSNEGSAFVLLGHDSWPQNFSITDTNASNSLIINGINDNDLWGAAVSSAGDVNGDNVDDFIIGSRGIESGRNKAIVIYGNKNLSGTINLIDLVGNNASVIVGENLTSETLISSAGDINSDGTPDILISAPNANFGRAYVVLSSDIIYANSFEQ